jgi:hypothetical protein
MRIARKPTNQPTNQPTNINPIHVVLSKFHETCFNIKPPHVFLLLQGAHNKIACVHFYSSPHVSHVTPISSFLFNCPDYNWWPIPVAVRSKAFFCGRSPAGIASLNSAGGMDVCVSVLSFAGRVLCDRPVPPSEKSYRVCVI